jgi:hypothetical protein
MHRSSVTFAGALRRAGWTAAPAVTEPPGRFFDMKTNI